MTRGSTLSGRVNPLQSAIRALFVLIAAIGGFLVFAASAAFALFIAAGLLILGIVVFAVFWLRAKILGKPLIPTPKMYGFQSFGETFETNSPNSESASKSTESGPVIDMHETPDGWSVDTE